MRSIRRLSALACLLLCAAGAMPAAAQSARVQATDPPDGAVLNVGETLYLRLEYSGDRWTLLDQAVVPFALLYLLALVIAKRFLARP